MSDHIKGITVEIGGDTTGLNNSLRKTDTELNNVRSSLKDVERLLKMDPTNTELLAQKQRLLAEAVEQTGGRLETLKQAEKQVQDQFAKGEISQAQYEALQREIIATEQSLDKLEDKAQGVNAALINISEGAKKIGEGAEAVAEKTEAVSTAAQAALAAGAAAAGKIIDSYADYEQLVGGIETLFKESADIVQSYAEDAYKTAGISANAYMETVTGFSASLISALGGDTAAAAELANLALTDMSDNANKMGSDFGSIERAYQGFAKGNFGMLDNLKLGFGGTKEEMQRLLDKAEEIAASKGLNAEFNMENYADIIEAIHLIQEDMGIAGATAAEAATTISGAFGMTKSALDNLVTGMGDANADIEGLMADVVSSISTLARNVLPVLQNIWNNLPKGAQIAVGITAVLAVISPLASAVSGLMTIFTGATAAVKGLSAVFTFFTSPAGIAIAAITGIIAIVAVLYENCEGFRQFVDNAVTFIVELLKSVVDFIGSNFLSGWRDGLTSASTFLGAFVAGIGQITSGICQYLSGILSFISGVFMGDWQRVWTGVRDIFSGIFNALTGIVKTVLNGIIRFINKVIDGVNALIKGINTVLDMLRKMGINFGQIPEIGKVAFLAKGGTLETGSAIVGERGPELLSMINGKARVTPLTENGGGGTQTAAAGTYNQTLNFYTAAMTPGEVARQTRNAAKTMLAGVK